MLYKMNKMMVVRKKRLAMVLLINVIELTRLGTESRSSLNVKFEIKSWLSEVL